MIDVLLVVGVSMLCFASSSPGTLNMVGSVLGGVALTVELVITVAAYSLSGLSTLFTAAITEEQRIAYGVARARQSDKVWRRLFPLLSPIFYINHGDEHGENQFPRQVYTIPRYRSRASGNSWRVLGIIRLIILWPVWFLAVGYLLFLTASGCQRFPSRLPSPQFSRYGGGRIVVGFGVLVGHRTHCVGFKDCGRRNLSARY